MSVQLMSSIFQHSRTRGNARLVLLALADGSSDDGVHWKSVAKIAAKANLSEQVTKEYMAAFSEIGLLSKVARHDASGRQTSNCYTINIEMIGSDDISQDVLNSVRPESRRRVGGANTGEGVGVGLTRVSGSGANTGQPPEGLTRVSPSYIESSEESSKEPSRDIFSNLEEEPNRTLKQPLLSEPPRVATPPPKAKREKAASLFDVGATVLEYLPTPFGASPRFLEAWRGFTALRKLKRAPLTDRAVKGLADDFRKWGVSKTIEALTASERKAWTDVYEPKPVNGKRHEGPCEPNMSMPSEVQF